MRPHAYDIDQVYIKIELLNMGFDISIVENLLEYENVTDLDVGVDLLIKGTNGWAHKFRPNSNRKSKRSKNKSNLCLICNEKDTEH